MYLAGIAITEFVKNKKPESKSIFDCFLFIRDVSSRHETC